MWIEPVNPKEQPKQCEDCGKLIILAKTEKGSSVAINAGFTVLNTLDIGDGAYLHLLSDDASHARTCAKKASAQPAMTRDRNKKNVDLRAGRRDALSPKIL